MFSDQNTAAKSINIIRILKQRIAWRFLNIFSTYFQLPAKKTLDLRQGTVCKEEYPKLSENRSGKYRKE